MPQRKRTSKTAWLKKLWQRRRTAVRHRLPQIDVLERRDLLVATPARFDFGSTSNVESNHTGINYNTIYSASPGYGWVSSSSGLSNVTGSSTDGLLRRDAVKGTVAKEFKIDVANGSYDVTVTMGHTAAMANAKFKLEGTFVDSDIDTGAGIFYTRTFRQTVSDGQLNVIFDDADSSKEWFVNGLVVESAASYPSALTTLSLDFGTDTSPIASGYERATRFTMYAPMQRYGWLEMAPSASTASASSDVRSDSVNGNQLHTFVADVANGTYNVTLTLGSSTASQSGVGVTLEGTSLGSISTSAGEYWTTTQAVSVSDGQLTLEISGSAWYLTDLKFGIPTDAVNDSNAINQNQLLTVSAPGLLSNDTGQTVTISSADTVSASGAIVTVSADGSYTYDPRSAAPLRALPQNQTASDTFSYTASGVGGTDTATATITVTGVNDAPTVSGAVTSSVTEDNGSYYLNMLTNASDVDTGTTLYVSNLQLTSGNNVGISSSGNSLLVNPSSYSYLTPGQTATICYSYTINDGSGGTVSQTATITIAGVNHAPYVSAAVLQELGNQVAGATVPLLTGASDPDLSDSLSVSNLQLVSGNGSGITLSGNALAINSASYQYLSAGQSETIQYSYQIIDSYGATVNQTATIKLHGGSADRFIDAGQPGFASYNFNNNGSGGFNGSQYTSGANYSGGYAAWTFSDLPAGTYDVFVTWNPTTTAANDAPFTILENTTLLSSTTVDQRIAPSGASVAGRPWQALGTVSVASPLTVRLSASATGTVLADAVRVVPHTPTGTDLRAKRLFGDGQNALFTYDVYNQASAPFNVQIYRSHDGIALDALLATQSVTSSGDLAVGYNRAISIPLNFTDVQQDYYLVAVVDAANAVTELLETNNRVLMDQGVFRTSAGIVQVHGTENYDSIYTSYNGTNFTLSLNGVPFTYTPSEVTSFHIRAHGGGDTLTAYHQLPVWFWGGAGNDYLLGGSADDYLDGGYDSDVLQGYGGDDVLLGGAGYGTNGYGLSYYYYNSNGGYGSVLVPYADSLSGGTGNDVLWGDAGPTDQDSGEGDVLFGEDGNDLLHGQAGRDTLLGGAGADTLDGGADIDRYDPNAGFDDVELLDGGQPNGGLYGPWYYETVGFNGDQYYATASAAAYGSWSFNDLPAGDYDVYATWEPDPQAAYDAPYTISHNGNTLATVSIDQRAVPPYPVVADAAWYPLGTYSVTTGPLVVRLDTATSGRVFDDAIRVVPHVAGGSSADLRMKKVVTNGQHLFVSYDVLNQAAQAFNIGVYRSADGITPGALLTSQRVTDSGQLAQGNDHTVTVPLSFTDVQEDFYLVVKLDAASERTEPLEDNNLALVQGVFRTADGVVHIQGSQRGDQVAITQTSSLNIAFNNTNYTYNTSDVTAIHFRSHAGGDSLSQTSLTKPVWFFGGDGNDYGYGGAAADYLDGGQDFDLLSGNGGDDTLVGGFGIGATSYGGYGYSADYLTGGDGNDTLYGDSASGNPDLGEADSLYGDTGDDVVYGGGGADSIYLGSGNDVGDGGQGWDLMYGGDGNDMLIGGVGGTNSYNNYWYGYGGYGYGGSSGDALSGESGDDLLYGDHGPAGGTGGEDDYLVGGEGQDQLFDGAGWDTLDPGNGWDSPELLDDSLSGFTSAGYGTVLYNAGVNKTLRYTAANSGDWFDWQFSSLAAGQYEVWGTWQADPSAATNATYTLLNGATTLTTYVANQRVEPSGNLVADRPWQLLGVVTYTSGTFHVRLDSSSTGIVLADAVLINRAPSAVADTNSVGEDGPSALGNVLTNDTDGDAGDTKRVTHVNGSLANVGQFLTLASGATLRLTSDGSYSYDPTTSATFQALLPGSSATDYFSYTMADCLGSSSTATVTLTINGANDAPVVTNASLSATEDGSSVTSSVLVSDAETAASALTYTILTQPSEGSVTSNGNGTFTFSPGTAFQNLAQGATRQVTFTYRATDPQSVQSNTGIGTITVTGVNDAPVATSEVSPLVLNDQSGVSTFSLAPYFADVDQGNHLTYQVEDNPGASIFQASVSNGNLIITPIANQSGAAYVQIRGTDNASSYVLTYVYVVVDDLNDAPEVVVPFEPVATDEDVAPAMVPLLGHFSDNDGDAITYAVSVSPAALISVQLADGNILFDPIANQNGVATVTVTATDANGAATNASFAVTVYAQNDAPLVVSSLGNRILEINATTALIDLSAHFADPDTITNQDSLTYSVVATDANGIATPVLVNNQLTLSSQADAFGDFWVLVRAEDEFGEWVDDTLNVSVRWPNSQPTAVAPSLTVNLDEDQAATYMSLTNLFTDADVLAHGDALTYSVVSVSSPNLVSATISGSNLVLEPQPNQHGTATLIIRATDTRNVFADVAVTASVSSILDAPTVTQAFPSLSLTQGGSSQTLNLSQYFADPDALGLTYSVNVTSEGSSSAVSHSLSGNTLTLSPAANSSGNALVTIVASNSQGTQQAAFGIRVKQGNVVPTVSQPVISKTLYEDESNITAQTIDLSLYFTDPDAKPGESLIYTLNHPVPSTKARATLVGSVVRVETWPDQNGTFDLLVTGTDVHGASRNATLRVTITPVNDAPTVLDPNKQIKLTEDAPEQTVNLRTLFKDIDLVTNPATETLSYSIGTVSDEIATVTSVAGTHGPNTALKIVLKGNKHGLITIPITATDSADATVSFDLKVNVDAVNDPPSVDVSKIPSNLDWKYSASNSVYRVYTLEELFSDPDNSLQLDAYVVSGDPAIFAGLPYISQGGTLAFELNPLRDGMAKIAIRATEIDGGQQWKEVAFTVTVQRNNLPTILPPDSQIIAPPLSLATPGTVWTYQVPVVGADTSDVLQFSLLEKPSGMSITSTGQISWTPSTAFAGQVINAIVRVTDGTPGYSFTRLLPVQVQGIRPTPQIIPLPETDGIHFTIDEHETLDFTLFATNQDFAATNQAGYTFELQGTNPVPGLELTTLPRFIWKPKASDGRSQPYEFTFVAKEQGGNRESEAYTVRIKVADNLPSDEPLHLTGNYFTKSDGVGSHIFTPSINSDWINNPTIQLFTDFIATGGTGVGYEFSFPTESATSPNLPSGATLAWDPVIKNRAILTLPKWTEPASYAVRAIVKDIGAPDVTVSDWAFLYLDLGPSSGCNYATDLCSHPIAGEAVYTVNPGDATGVTILRNPKDEAGNGQLSTLVLLDEPSFGTISHTPNLNNDVYRAYASSGGKTEVIRYKWVATAPGGTSYESPESTLTFHIRNIVADIDVDSNNDGFLDVDIPIPQQSYLWRTYLDGGNSFGDDPLELAAELPGMIIPNRSGQLSPLRLLVKNEHNNLPLTDFTFTIDVADPSIIDVLKDWATPNPTVIASGHQWGNGYQYDGDLRLRPKANGKTKLTMTLYNGENEIVSSDSCYITVVAPFDVDVDSDNNDGLNLPSRTFEEESLEPNNGSGGNVRSKLIVANNGDADNDGVPDYADGYALVDDERFLSSLPSQFVPVVISVPREYDLDAVQLRFEYSAVAPQEIDLTAAIGRDGNVFTQIKPSRTGFRLWTTNSGNRNPQLVTASGNYVAPGVYRAADLGITESSDRSITLYVEGVADQAINLSGNLTVTMRAQHERSPGYIDSDVVALSLIGLNARIDSDNSGTIDAFEDERIEASQPGKYVPLSSGDADDDGFEDAIDPYGDNGKPASADFVPLELSIPSGLDPAKARIRFVFSEASLLTLSGNLRIWRKPGAQNRNILPATFGGDLIPANTELTLAQIGLTSTANTTLYIQGLRPTASVEEGTIRVELNMDVNASIGWSLADELLVSVISADLDIDSDNDNGSNAPTRSAAEEQKELANAANQSLGKVVVANTLDRDGDFVPDYADGLNILEQFSNDASGNFTPLIFQLSPNVVAPHATFRFIYSASDPAEVAIDSNKVYSPATSGFLRLWKKDGVLARKVASVKGSGDFLASGIAYTGSELGYVPDANSLVPSSISLFVEGIQASSEIQSIRLEVDPDGPLGPAGFIVADAVSVSVISLDISWDNATPLQSQREYLENVSSGVEFVGKIIQINDGDFDADAAPNYADGINKFGNQGINASDSFVRLNFSYGGPAAVFAAGQFYFSYSGSDPDEIEKESPGGSYSPTYEPQFAEDTSRKLLRLWTRDGLASRKVSSDLGPSGDYLAPGKGYTRAAIIAGAGSTATFYVEGIQRTESWAAASIKSYFALGEYVELESVPESQSLLGDSVSVSVLGSDLDVDTDNTNGLERDLAEDQFEAYREAASPDKYPGKKVPWNVGDVDGDSINNLFDEEKNAQGAGPSVPFVPLVIDIPAPIDPAKATVRIAYKASDPRWSKEVAVGNRKMSTVREPEEGHLRLWINNGNTERNFWPLELANLAGLTGDFVAPDIGYTLSQLRGGATGTTPLTLWVEGVVPSNAWGEELIEIKVDPDGYDGPLTEYTLDSARMTVMREKSSVVLTAIDRFASESDTSKGERQDIGAFTLSRGEGNTWGALEVALKVQPQSSGWSNAVYATDFRLATTPTSGIIPVNNGIARITIPEGLSSVTIYVLPTDNLVSEWNEALTLEIVDSPAYLTDSQYGGTSLGGTPYGGVNGPNVIGYSIVPTPAELRTVLMLDNDGVSGQLQRNIDTSGTGLAKEVVGNHLVAVDLQQGQVDLVANLSPSTFVPRYRGDDNLLPVLTVELQLPGSQETPMGMEAQLTFAGLVMEPMVFEIPSHAPPGTVLRLSLMGDERISHLPTGHYDYSIEFTFDCVAEFPHRFVRGSTEIVNLFDDQAGNTELGRRWWIDELDRLVPADGSSEPKTKVGLVPNAGLALMRGDNTSAFFAATPSQVRINNAPDVVGWINGTHQGGRGGDYQVRPDGNSSQASWNFSGLVPNRQYQVAVTWVPDSLRSQNALYKVNAQRVGTPLSQTQHNFEIDQRLSPGDLTVDGTRWRSLGYFTVDESGNLSVELSGEGQLAADAVMLVEDWNFTTPVGTFDRLELVRPGSQILASEPNDIQFVLHDKFGGHAEFDRDGLLRMRVDRNANRTQYEYVDADDSLDSIPNDGRADEISKITVQGGLETSFEYVGGHLHKVVDFAGRETTFTISTEGYVLDVEAPKPTPDAEPSHFGFEYVAPGSQLSRITDPRNNATTIGYSTLTRRVTSVNNPDLTAFQLSPYITDGILAQNHSVARKPASGNIADASTFGSQTDFVEPRARYTDARSLTITNASNRYHWFYQFDAFGLTTALAKPPMQANADPDDPRQNRIDVWLWERRIDGLVTKATQPAGGGGFGKTIGGSVQYLTQLITQFAYDVFGNVSEVIYPDDPSAKDRWEYEPRFSSPTKYTDRAGFVTRFALDAHGNTTDIFENDSRRIGDDGVIVVRQTHFDFTLPPNSILGLAGGLTTHTTVAAGLNLDAVMTRTDYYESGTKIGLASKTTYGLTPYGTPTGVTADVEYDYDDGRNLTSVKDELERESKFEYDRLNRLIYLIAPNPDSAEGVGTTTQFVYDAAGNQTHVVLPDPDASGPLTISDTESVYDTMNRLWKTILPSAGGHADSDQGTYTTEYQFDPNGNVAAVVEPQYGRQTTFAYDNRNQLSAKILPAPDYITFGITLPSSATDQPTIYYAYDSLGNLSQASDPRNTYAVWAPTGNKVWTRYNYDELSRNTEVSFTSNPHSNISVRPTTTTQYDVLGRVTKVLAPGANTSGNQTSVSEVRYDSLGRVAREISPSDDKSRRMEKRTNYDLRDNVVSEAIYVGGNLVGDVTSFIYDLRNRLVAVNHPNPFRPGTQSSNAAQSGLMTVFAYDDAGQKLAELTYAGDQVANTLITDGAGPDLAGLLSTTTSRFSASEAARLTQYQYDRRGRLVQTILPDPDGNGTQQSPWITVSYDALDRAFQSTTHFTDIDGTQRALTSESIFDQRGQTWNTLGPANSDGVRPETVSIYNNDGTVREVRVKQVLTGETDNEAAWQATVYRYDNLRRIYQTTDSAGLTSFNFYDALNHAVYSIDAQGWISKTEYDYSGQALFTSRNVITAEADDTTPTEAQGQISRSDYYANGLLRSSMQFTDAGYVGVKNEYDNRGNLSRQTQDDGEAPAQVDYFYSAAGFLDAVRDPRGNLVGYDYDNVGRVVRETITNPEPLIRDYRYDDFGNLVQSIDRNQRTIQFTYDNSGRRTAEEWYDTTAAASRQEIPLAILPGVAFDQVYHAEFRYTELGELASSGGTRSQLVGLPQADPAHPNDPPSYSSINHTGTYDFVFDNQRRVRQSTQTQSIGGVNTSIQFGYEYDLLGNTTKRAIRRGTAPYANDTFEYDSLNRITGAKELTPFEAGEPNASLYYTYPASKEVLYTYTGANLSSVIRYGDTAQQVAASTYVFNGDGRLRNEAHVGISSADPLFSRTYAYDRSGRVTQIESPQESRTNQYDQRGQLTQTTTTNTSSKYRYDASGNRAGSVMNNRLTFDGVSHYGAYDDEGNVLERTTYKEIAGQTKNYAVTAGVSWLAGIGSAEASVSTSDIGYSPGDYRLRIDPIELRYPNNPGPITAVITYYSSNGTIPDWIGTQVAEITLVPVATKTNGVFVTEPREILVSLATDATHGRFTVEFTFARVLSFGDAGIGMVGALHVDKVDKSYSYEYDYQNRLTRTEVFDDRLSQTADNLAYVIDYLYDVLGNQVAELKDSVGGFDAPWINEDYAKYYVSERNRKTLEFDAQGRILQHDFYAPSLDMLLAADDFDFLPEDQVQREVVWPIADSQGTVRAITTSDHRNGNGQSLPPSDRVAISYDPFGIPYEPYPNPYSEAPRDLIRARFHGMEYDLGSELYHLSGKGYDAVSGRLLSENRAVAPGRNPYTLDGNSPDNGRSVLNGYSGASASFGSEFSSLYTHYLNPANTLQEGWERGDPLMLWLGAAQVAGWAAFVIGSAGAGAEIGVGAFGLSAAYAYGGAAAGVAGGAISTYANNPNAGIHEYGFSMGVSGFFGGMSPAGAWGSLGGGLIGGAGNAHLGNGEFKDGYNWGDLAGGMIAGGVDDGIRAMGKFMATGKYTRQAASGLAALHGAGHFGVEAGVAATGGALGYAATGSSDGALLGANLGSMVGGVAANFMVACFAAGTKVLTPTGYKLVEELTQHDLVAARAEDDFTAAVEYKPIEEVFIRQAYVIAVVVAGRKIATTAEHPFYVQDQGWVPAGQLRVGDLVHSHDGQWTPVTAVELTGTPAQVYNFRIADHHTYFIGADDWGFSVWVHNTYFKQVGYRRNDLSRHAWEYRKTLDNPKAGVNIAVIEYESKSGKLIRKVIESNGQHSERRLIEALPQYVQADKSRIKRIFTELEPCGPDYHNCDAYLRRMAPDATVTYSFKYRNPDDRQAEGMAALLRTVRALVK